MVAIVKQMSKLISLVGLILLLSSAPLRAEDAAGVDWGQLSKQEQSILKRFSGNWSEFSAQKQQRLQKGAKHLAGMSSKKRKEAYKRFKNWQSLPEEQREKIRKRYQRFKKLTPKQQKQVVKARERFKKLDKQQRERVRDKWDTMTPRQRRQAITGDRLNRNNSGGIGRQGNRRR